MPTPPVKRCSQCKKDRKKCVMNPETGTCDWCKARGYECEDYSWPTPPHAASQVQQTSTKPPTNESRASQPNRESLNSRRPNDPNDRGFWRDDGSRAENLEFAWSSSSVEPGAQTLSTAGSRAAYDATYPEQSPAVAVQQNYMAVASYSGYNNAASSYEPSSGDVDARYVNWELGEDASPYQATQGGGSSWQQQQYQRGGWYR